MSDVTIPPGSPEAIKSGCLCPVMDNHHGKGITVNGKTAFWINSECPIHGANYPEARGVQG